MAEQSRAELIDIVGRILVPDDWDNPNAGFCDVEIHIVGIRTQIEEIVTALRPESVNMQYVRANGSPLQPEAKER